MGKQQQHRVSKLPRFLPGWKGNFLLFGLLITVVLGYFFWQVRQAQQAFLNHAREHSAMLAGVIERNARSALLSQEVIEEIMQIFLGNTARFVDYLDAIEPFSGDELAAYAREAGLAGIRIIEGAGESTEGPPGWFPDQDAVCEKKSGYLRHLPQAHLYFLAGPRAEEPGCIVVGITASHIETLHEQVGLPHLLESLTGLSRIRYVRIETGTHDVHNPLDTGVILSDNINEDVAETRLLFGSDVLVIGMSTKHLFVRIRQLWNEFFVFSAILAILGIFFSWLLHRYQTAYLNQVQDFEREIAREREDAALGRAAAAITHEIRNPLNAISMGLQRLQIEAEDLDDEYRELVANLIKAVKRTNGIVTNIRRYAKPLEAKKQSVSLKPMIRHILMLYARKCEEHSIDLKCEIRYDEDIIGDAEILEQVVENLIKNSIEALQNGGWLRIILDREEEEAVFTIENSGFELPPDEAGRILEPYFTTKARGTGLGLAIVGKIIRAHKGRLAVSVPAEGVLRVRVCLPIS
ncbi:ATP-binding protein [Desulfococcaceae bacterium HSG8]|nr:ATP-binding protein [Desulfococcaceae bacterium HSG8]